MPRQRYWNVERLCNLAACLREISDDQSAIVGDEGLTRRVCRIYWKKYDETPQFAQIMRALSHLGSAGVIDTSQAKIRGATPVRQINPSPSKTRALIIKAGSMYKNGR